MREEEFWSRLTNNMRMYRESADILQKDIAKKLGVSESGYRSYELGDRRIPVNLLVKLAEIYDVSVDALIGNTPKEEEPAIVSGNFTLDQTEKIKKYAELVKNGLL